MVFSSLYFLFLYLPIVLFLYYITPLKWRNLLLLLVNLVFYAWGEPVYILIMFLSIGIDYTHGMLVEKYKRRGNDRGARWAVASSVIFNLALLFFFKYWDFVAGSLQAIGFSFMPKLGLSLPIGISFYTFQTMSYTIDVYRDDAKVQRSLVNFGTFVTLFPQLIAGPIIKYKDLGDQIDHRTHSPEQFASGVQIFVVGLAKKVLLANNIGKLWDTILALPARELTTAGAWLGVAAFAFQLYFDFSGYSDMAIGLGKMFGFHFLENFNYPYISRSITEFWRRWHISLSTWFRDYVYFPLGGSRVNSKAKHIRNLFVVWLLTGVWHGANWTFLAWGLFYFVLLVLEKYGGLGRGWPVWAKWLFTFLMVNFAWVLFRADSLAAAGQYLQAMFGLGAGGWDDLTALYLRENWTVLAASVLFAGPLAPRLRDWAAKKDSPLLDAGYAVLAAAVFLVSAAFLIKGTYNPFIYFNF